VPAGLVEHKGGVLVIGDGRCEAVEEFLHRLRVGIGHHKGEGIVRTGFDGREDVGEGEALIGEARRALATLPPDMTDAAFLADARLVLEEEADALVFMRTLKFFQQRRGSF